MAYLTSDEYIMYLRKSRADNPHESVEEVLEKHETILQELAERDLGGRIPEHCIYREVVSGETISERPEMMSVLTQIENPKLKAVLVVEPQRLSRGDLEDCGRIVNAFRYSKTEVKTMNMVYDLSNKMQRKFFEQELMRGNDFLEYTKEILLRGRIAAVKRGCYIGNIPPWGYDKIVNGDGDNTLKPNENAAFVKMIFEMYVNENKSYLEIARHLDKLGVKPLKSKIWEKNTIRVMLANKHYIGKVVFFSTKTIKEVINGEVVTRRDRKPDKDETIIAEGKHEAIVPLELFQKAQEKLDNAPRVTEKYSLKNPLAGLLFCSKCGRAMAQHPYPRSDDRYECRNRNGCGAKSVKMKDLIDAVAFALEAEHLPDLQVKLSSNAGYSEAIQRKQLERLQKELEDLHMQEDKQFELLEKGTYTEEIFKKRNHALHVEMDNLKSKIYEARQTLPKTVNYEEKIINLKKAIEALRDDSVSIETKNVLLKSVVFRINYEFLGRESHGVTNFRLHIYLDDPGVLDDHDVPRQRKHR